MFQTNIKHGNESFSPILITLKPILILCKCFGVCSLPILKCTHLSQVKYSVLSFSVVYQMAFVICCELNVHGVYKWFISEDPLTMGTFFHAFNILLLIVCTMTDKKLLGVLTNMDASDQQLRPLLQEKNNNESGTGYTWLLYMIVFQMCLYFFIYCTDEKCIESYFITIVYRQMPFLLMACLFCGISTELWKRFELLKKVLQQNNSCDPKSLEECRDVHCKLVQSSELFCQSFSARVTLQLVMITLHTISFFCFPCIHGNGCEATFLIKGIAQQTILVSVICYYASHVDEKNQDILDDLNLIPLESSPFKCKDQIQLFSCQVVLSPVKVTALGLFDVDMTTILAVLSVTLMYTVIVAQLGDRLEPYMQS